MLTLPSLVKWLDQFAVVVEENKELLTRLDAAIGDADHGINLTRGTAAVKAALAATPPATIAAACKTVSMTLIKSVGGASGPLYGTFFMKMAPLLPGDSTSVSDFADAFAAGIEGVEKIGKSHAGEKTLLDALIPAAAALQEAAAGGKSDPEAFALAAAAAEQGMKDTIPLLATKGRASYLGDRSIGHQDPGATSAALLLRTLADCVG